jgi:hypothetical protein
LGLPLRETFGAEVEAEVEEHPAKVMARELLWLVYRPSTISPLSPLDFRR